MTLNGLPSIQSSYFPIQNALKISKYKIYEGLFEGCLDSPACLAVTDDAMSMQLARMLKQAGQQAPEVKPVLEVNPEHALVKKLDGSVHFHDLAHILFDQALLAEGGLPADPAAYVKRVNALLS
jgi:molecular chaperone HtpG